MRPSTVMIRSRPPRHGLGRMVCAGLLAVLTVISACSSHKAVVKPTATRQMATAQPTTATLPAFSDWRVAYLDASANLHAVSTDGKTDIVGPNLPGFTTTGFNLPASSVSPNGHLLAYGSDTTLIASLAGGSSAVTNVPGSGGTYGLAWSPDGSLLAISNNVTMPLMVRSSDLQTRQIPTPPAYQSARIGRLYGWLDATHIVVDVAPRPAPPPPRRAIPYCWPRLTSSLVRSASSRRLAGRFMAPRASPYHLTGERRCITIGSFGTFLTSRRLT